MKLLLRRMRHPPLLVGLLVAAVGIAAVAVARPYFRQSVLDGLSDEYDEIAINLVEHGSYSANLEHWDKPTVTRGPGYPLYLAGAFEVFGVRNTGTAGVIDMLVHALAAALLTDALRALVTTRAAVAGGLVFAFWPTTFYYAAKGSSETLLILWLAASLYLLVHFRARPSPFRALGLGACLGLACLTRGSAVVMLGVVVVWAIANAARGVLRWKVVALAGLAWALTMSPWWIRNARISGAFVPFHSLTWYNSYFDDTFDRGRQWLASQGMQNVSWSRVDIARFPESVPRPPLGFEYPPALDARADLAQERRYRAIMLEKFRNPGYLLDKIGRNAVDFWSAADSASKSRTLLLTSLAWLALWVAGLVAALRDPSLRWLILLCLSWVVLTWMLYLPFFAVFRHSVPTAPFIAATLGLGLGARARASAGPGAP